MKRQPLDMYDDYSSDMVKYLKQYGWHFNKKLFDYAVSKLKNKDGSKFEPITKEQFEAMLTRYGVKLENDVMCDGLFVANICKCRYLRSSIVDEQHLCLYVKDMLDAPDASDGEILNDFYSDSVKRGMPIDWYEMR